LCYSLVWPRDAISAIQGEKYEKNVPLSPDRKLYPTKYGWGPGGGINVFTIPLEVIQLRCLGNLLETWKPPVFLFIGFS
jgi:hypothetical protein